MQDVKHVVKDLDAQGRSETQNHCEVYRPWGSYDSVDMGGRFQVKHITVKPGARLSLQMHHHRAEHWIVVSGTAQVTCDDKTFLLTENQSTYIPIASVHRLANPGKIPLEIIEVQSGSYLGEDDIERLEDVYGRTAEPALQWSPAAAEASTRPLAERSARGCFFRQPTGLTFPGPPHVSMKFPEYSRGADIND